MNHPFYAEPDPDKIPLERRSQASAHEEPANNGQPPPFAEKQGARQDGENDEPTTPPLTGASLVELSARQINESDTLLGQRWLCRGGGAIVVGPSGQGKSSMAVQAAVLWACGRSAFGIKPTQGALRVLIVQAEDDEGDCIEMARMVDDLRLTENESKQVANNTLISNF